MGMLAELNHTVKCSWCGEEIEKYTLCIIAGRKAYHERCAGAEHPNYGTRDYGG